MFARLTREPLVHFLLVGLLLFLLSMAVGGSRSSGPNVRIDDAVVAELVGRFEATWQRPPSATELRGLMDSYVRDEIFYREGLALGLDRDDQQVKRRVRQKVEVIAEESGANAPATEADLRAWLMMHSARYAEPALLTFQQVMIDPAKRGASSAATAARIRSQLQAGANPATLGDSNMLPVRIDMIPLDLVARDFGESFAAALATTKVGSWEGPIHSGFGIHLVRLERRVPGRIPTLDKVRAVVARDWEVDRRSKAADAYYRDLRKDYPVQLTATLPAPSKP